MNQEKPKVYSAEFRESAVKLANESDKPIAQTARDIGVNENTLHTWISKVAWMKCNGIREFVASISLPAIKVGAEFEAPFQTFYWLCAF